MMANNLKSEIYDPKVETRKLTDQKLVDENLFRKQITYLFEHSKFYQNKLRKSGFKNAKSVGGLDNLEGLPFTTKDELRKSQSEAILSASHWAAPIENIARIYSTSGTSGTPMYIPLTRNDLACWILTSKRAYTAAGIRPHHRVLTTYNSGPFVAGAVGESLQNLGVNLIPIGTGNTERLIRSLQRFKPNAMPGTPSFLLYIAETARSLGIDPAKCGLETLVCGGEPGASEPAVRSKLQTAFNSKVYEVMGVGDISISMWGESSEQEGMHFCAQDFVYVELINPNDGKTIKIEDGATGELVYTHLQHEAAPLLRFRSRDHVIIKTGSVKSGRTGSRVKCVGRTDDMIIVRGVNVFPSAIREVVSEFQPVVSGIILLKLEQMGVKQSPPISIKVELAEKQIIANNVELALNIEKRIRDKLVFSSRVILVAHGSLQRSEYKTNLISYSDTRLN